jgi:hypothetical protein
VTFLVGANFPWIDCGWDFGPPPPGWRRDPPRDWARLEQDLRELRALGIRVVRWWVLAGGVNYPAGRSIADIATERGLLRKQWQLRPGVALPALGDAFVADFSRLLAACAAAGVQLVPSLVSFEWFAAERGGSRGRANLVFGVDERLSRVREHVDAFLEATLAPLLAASGARRSAIFAWETVNEPDWVVHGGPLLSPILKSVESWEMNTLIQQATERIVRAGFVATTGFKRVEPGWVAADLWATLRRTAEQGAYVHQLHHYPVLGSTRLAPASSSPIQPVVVGELPTAMGRFGTPANQRWGNPELAESERREDEYLLGRLRLIRALGYAGAWLWSTEPAWLKERRGQRGGEREPDPRVRWTYSQRAQVRRLGE